LDYERDTKNILIGKRITVQTLMGVKGNIVGRLPDGRVVIFNRDSPYRSMLALDQSVECSINYVSERYVIVDPIREPKPIERLKPKEPDLSEKLRRLSEEGEWETAIFARALLHIMEMFDALKAKPPKRSSQKTDLVIEELVEHSPASDDFLQAAESFGLTQMSVREQKTPKSEFLRYLKGNQEERKNYGLLSINIENFGSVGDIPKDMRLLTMGQTRYLKQKHLKGIDGYDEIENLSNFFVEASALTRDEYGNVFYASTGTNPWNKVQRITVKRDDS